MTLRQKLEQLIASWPDDRGDKPDTDYQRGYMAAAEEHARELADALRTPAAAAGEDVVERVAKAIADGYFECGFGDAHKNCRAKAQCRCRRDARAALAALSAAPPPAAESRAREVHSDFRELMDAAWAINDRLRITPGMEAIFTGSTNDIDRFRDLLHDLEPAYRTAQEPAADSQITTSTGD